MKKSKQVVITAVLVAAIISCRQKEKEGDWIAGSENGRQRDTTLNGNQFRYFGGLWYPIYGGLISPRAYRGASLSEISRPGYTPTRIRTGGFGASSRTTSPAA